MVKAHPEHGSAWPRYNKIFVAFSTRVGVCMHLSVKRLEREKAHFDVTYPPEKIDFSDTKFRQISALLVWSVEPKKYGFAGISRGNSKVNATAVWNLLRWLSTGISTSVTGQRKWLRPRRKRR